MGNYNNIKPDTSKYHMNWYKFLIYFGLFAGALVNFSIGITLITGDYYFVQTGELTADMVYGTFGSALKDIDQLYGMGAITMAVISIVLRNMLAGYRKRTLKYVNFLYGGMFAINVLYILAVIATIDEWVPMATSVFLAIAIHAFMWWANNKYFNKRSAIFIND